MGTKYVSNISKGTCTTLVRLRIHLLLRRVIRQLVWRGHGGNIGLKSFGMDPHCSLMIPSNMLPPHCPPHGKGLPQAGIKIVCDLLPHVCIGMIRTRKFPQTKCPSMESHNRSSQLASHVLNSAAILKNNTHISYTIISQVQ